MLHARALLALLLVLWLSACGSSSEATDAAPADVPATDTSGDQGAADAEPAADVPDTPAETANETTAEPVEPLADVAEEPDLPLEELPADVLIPLSVELHVDAAACAPSAPGVGIYRVSLAWTTSIAATSSVEVALNDFTASFQVPVTEEPTTDHALPLEFTAFHFGQVPKVGDVILVRVHAEAPAGQLGASEPISVAVSAAVRACLYPYDSECSDNAQVLCRVMPPVCAAPLVLAAFEGCYHCVFAATCTCDDGDPAECPAAPPECGEGLVMAVQAGCFACVDPVTCAPPAE